MKISTIFKSGMMMLLALMISTISFGQAVDKDPAVEGPAISQVASPDAIHDVQFYHTAQTLATGIVWVPTDTSFWVSYWQSDSIYRYDASGSLLERFTVPVTGSRSITYDGTNLWFGNASTTITSVDPVTRMQVSTVTVPENARYLTYDPNVNNGAGGFWLGNWSTDLYQVDMSGNTVSQIAAVNLPASRYGAVYDSTSVGGPYVWLFHQSSATTSAEAVQYNLSTGMIDNTIDMNAKFGTLSTSLAGGMTITDALYPTPSLVSVIQNDGFGAINLLDDHLVKFSVNMNQYGGSTANGVFVNGNFNGWCGACNPLSDDDGDGIWEGYYAWPTGTNGDSIEYKYTVDGWNDQEQFASGDPCTITDPSGQFVNRFVLLSGNTELPSYCWNTCTDQCTPINITFELNTANITPDMTGMFIGGGSGFGGPTDNQLTDMGNGIYTITIQKTAGFSSHYTFLNGNCGWGCKEDISGLPCADPANFNDRFLPPTFSDTTIKACFGTCDSDGSCSAPPADVNVTFNINMDSAPDSIKNNFTTVYVSGSFNNWDGAANPLTDNGDGTWSTTIPISNQNDSIEYKFQVDQWAAQEELAVGSSCTKTTGAFTNRITAVADSVQPMYCWSVCTTCLSSVGGLAVDDNLFELNPNLVNNFTNITFKDEVINKDKTVIVYNAVGQIVFNSTINNEKIYRLETSNYANGLYFVTVKTDEVLMTKKFVVSK